MRVWGYVLILIGLCAGCSGDAGVEKTLNAAADLMEERPDSALLLLEELPAQQIVDRRQSARYALLLTQARHKNYIDEQNDSLIGMAVDYFQRHGGEEEQMKSLFYQGVVRNNADDYGRAIICAMRAKELAERLQDEYWAGRSCELMADIYNAAFFSKEAVESRKQAVQHYEKAKSELFHKYALLHLAMDYDNQGEYSEGISLLDSLYTFVALGDTVYLADVLSAFISVYNNSDQYLKANDYLQELKKLPYAFVSSDYAMAADIYTELGKSEAVGALIDSAFALAKSENDQIIARAAQMHYYKQKGDYQRAQHITDSLLKWQNGKISEILDRSVVSVQRDYYRQQTQLGEIRIRQTRFFLVMVAVIALLVLVSGAVIYRLRMKIKKDEIEHRMAEIQLLAGKVQNGKEENLLLNSRLSEQTNRISVLMDKLESQKDESEALREWVERLYKERFATMNILCDEYFERGDSEKMKLLLYNKVEQEIRKFIHPDNLKRIEEMVNGCQEQLIVKLRCQLPELKADDVAFLTLLYAGFVPRAICLFLGIKSKTFYTKRSRLKERILRSDAPDREWFIEKMNPII